MRRGNTPKAIYNEETEEFVGFDLSADFTSEHEWGIQSLMNSFKIKGTDGEPGVDRRSVNAVAKECLHLYNSKDQSSLLFYDGDNEPHNDGADSNIPDDGVGAAWSENDFGIFVRGEKLKSELDSLYASILNKDAVIFLGGGGNNPFERSGLVIAIKSRLPYSAVDMMVSADSSRDRLVAAADRLGIESRLRAAGKKWFALSPRWVNSDEREIKFWLNPRDQDKHNAGWFSPEELNQWVKDDGPVPK